MLTCTRNLLVYILLLFILPFSGFAQNNIANENALTGNPSSEWDITGAGDLTIQGFATTMSVNKGTPISFKVTMDAGISYNLKIYRLGYYQGNGARLVASLGPFTGISQAACIADPVTGQVDCGNWISQASWNVPSTAISGIYIGKLTRSDNGGSSHMIFVVRDDAANAPILFKTSDATWQAYNDYGGNNVYGGTVPGYPDGHATKVSYNRPFINRRGVMPNPGQAGLTGLFNAEYAMVRWMERNGYDMSYTSCVDIAKDSKAITPNGAGGTYAHKIVLSVGHDEYWSAEEKIKFENARNAGVNLAFFSGNEVYWKTRWENSIDGSSTPYRTLVCYKEGYEGDRSCGGKCDPLPNVWTGLWRSGGEFPLTDAFKPENALTGQISWEGVSTAIKVPSAYKNYRIWNNTSIEGMSAGQSVTFPNGTLGHEWDPETLSYLSTYPAHRITLSSTIVDKAEHKLSLYKYSNGALVFGAGTVQWSWGLDEYHDRTPTVANQDMQQATVNLLSDMGVTPATRQVNLTAPVPSTDLTAPVVVINSPVHLSTITGNTAYIISGTASDVGGEVGGVELSFDNGVTWKPATGTNTWTYEWAAPISGPVSFKVRAFDDSWNLPSAGNETVATVNITAIPPVTCPCSNLLGSTIPASPTAITNGRAITVGTRFRSYIDGYISGVRFYKSANNSGTHTGLLFSNTGTLLAQVNFSSETASGWQEASFSKPFYISSGTTYVIAYYSSNGYYSSTPNDFQNSKINFPIIGMSDGNDGINGVSRNYITPVFPVNGNSSTNYWVDVSFIPGVDTDLPINSNIVATTNSNGTAVITWTTNEFTVSKIDFGTNSSSLNQSAADGTYSLNHSITLSGLQPLTTYYFRVNSKDFSNNSTVSPASPAAPLQFTMPLLVCASTDSETEFKQGTLDANSTIAFDGNGALLLKPVFSEDFSDPTTPTGWTSGSWTGSPTPQYLGGIAILNGNHLFSNTSYTQGNSIEFYAKFTDGDYQNIGYSADGLFNNPWIVIGRANGNPAGNLYARRDGGADVLLGTGLTGQYHRFKIKWNPANFEFYVDDVLAATVTKTMSTAVFQLSDYNSDGQNLSIDWIRVSPYPASGTYTSKVFDAGSTTNWSDIKWTGYQSAGNSLNVSVRTGNSAIPDGTWAAFTPITNGGAIGKFTRYLQYQVSLLTSDISSTSVLQSLSVSCNFAFPIKLLDFNGKIYIHDVLLDWSTGSEFNNKGFEIQRSENNTDWVTIGFVKGAGNSSITQKYIYHDKNLKEGIYYYRLLQIDLDDKRTYSKVVTINFKDKTEYRLDQNFPNPSTGQTRIGYSVPKSGSVKLVIIDLQGRLVRSIEEGIKSAGQHYINISIANLRPGIYYYKMVADGFISTKKMIVQ